MARPGIEPRTSDLRVRCPSDCAMWPGSLLLLSRANFLWTENQILETYVYVHFPLTTNMAKTKQLPKYKRFIVFDLWVSAQYMQTAERH